MDLSSGNFQQISPPLAVLLVKIKVAKQGSVEELLRAGLGISPSTNKRLASQVEKDLGVKTVAVIFRLYIVRRMRIDLESQMHSRHTVYQLSC